MTIEHTAITSPPEPTDPEAVRYRERAEQAEGRLEAQAAELERVRRQLAESEDRLGALERRAKLDAALTAADAADLEAARTLAEAALASMETPDVERAVGEVCRRRPYLFRARAAASGAMAPRVEEVRGAEHAAEAARATGDRRHLLAYLQLRRRRAES